jgi:MYXO-CTERM domain-containing protein
LWVVAAVLFIPEAHAIVAVSIHDGEADPGGSTTLGMELTIHEDMVGFAMTIQYDSTAVSMWDVARGPLMTDWGEEGLTWTDDPTAGELRLVGSAHGLDPISSTSGGLVHLSFGVNDVATIGDVVPITFASAEFYDAEGATLRSFTEDGQITVTDPDEVPVPPMFYTLTVADIEAAPGESVAVEVWLTNETPALALVFELWVDGSVISLDETAAAEMSSRSTLFTVISTPLTADSYSFAIGASPTGPTIPEGEGWIVQLPFRIAEEAPAGVRSLMVSLPAAYDYLGLAVDVTGIGGTLTVTEAGGGDTGAPPDTGETPDTGEAPGMPGDTAEDESPGESDPGGVESGPGADAGAGSETKSGCACASTPTPVSLWPLIGLLGLLAARRRVGHST